MQARSLTAQTQHRLTGDEAAAYACRLQARGFPVDKYKLPANPTKGEIASWLERFPWHHAVTLTFDHSPDLAEVQATVARTFLPRLYRVARWAWWMYGIERGGDANRLHVHMTVGGTAHLDVGQIEAFWEKPKRDRNWKGQLIGRAKVTQYDTASAAESEWGAWLGYCVKSSERGDPESDWKVDGRLVEHFTTWLSQQQTLMLARSAAAS